MQAIRNLIWRLFSFSYIGIFVFLFLVGQKLTGLVDPMSKEVMIAVYASLIIGFLNPTKFLQSIDTFVHEVGHAMTASIAFGSIYFIKVHRDSNGVTFWSRRNHGRIVTAFVSASGPLASVIFFAVTARLVSLGLTSTWILGLMVATALITITTIRNFWGWLTGIALLVLGYWMLFKGFSFSLAPAALGSVDIQVTSAVSAILCVAALNVGISIRYSLGNRIPRGENQDEYRFGRAIFLGPVIGGNLLVLLELAILMVGLSFLLGWSSPLALEGFL